MSLPCPSCRPFFSRFECSRKECSNYSPKARGSVRPCFYKDLKEAVGRLHCEDLDYVAPFLKGNDDPIERYLDEVGKSIAKKINELWRKQGLL